MNINYSVPLAADEMAKYIDYLDTLPNDELDKHWVNICNGNIKNAVAVGTSKLLFKIVEAAKPRVEAQKKQLWQDMFNKVGA